MADLSHIFDTHCHYDDKAFGGREKSAELIGSLFADGLSGLIHASTDPSSAEFGLWLSERFDRAYTSVGIHPEYASQFTEADVAKLESVAKAHKKVVAVGEIGLDYHYEGFDRDAQIKLFCTQVELANSLDIPVIVHCRDAIEDCLKILKELRPKGVMHCFSGSWETARGILDLGMYLGFTGVLTFKNAKKAVEVVSKMPIELFLTETDCPYMAPEPHRGEISHSGMIEFIVRRAAQIRNISEDELRSTAEKNAEDAFGLNAI